MPFAINSLILKTFKPNNRKIFTPEINEHPLVALDTIRYQIISWYSPTNDGSLISFTSSRVPVKLQLASV